MEEAIEKQEYKGYTVEIYSDDMPTNPREWENLGIMVCFHSRYDLGDKHDLGQDMFQSWEEVKQCLVKEEKAVVIFSLYLYDHSGITIRASGNGNPFYGRLPQGHAEFDSGQVGFIYVTREAILKAYDTKKITPQIKEKIKKTLFAEVNIYNYYLEGSVYGFIVKKGEEEIDSCWGFFGYDWEDNGLLEHARDGIDWDIECNRRKKQTKIKTLIKHHVPLDKREEQLNKERR